MMEPFNKQCRLKSDDRPASKIPPPVVYIGMLLAGASIHYFYSIPVMATAPALVIGSLLILAGVFLHGYSMRTLTKAGTTFHAEEGATVLVKNGPYQISRNPIYLGMGLEYVGLSLLANSVWMLILVIPVFAIIHYAVIDPEEVHLHRTFGEDYKRYSGQVRRWI